MTEEVPLELAKKLISSFCHDSKELTRAGYTLQAIEYDRKDISPLVKEFLGISQRHVELFDTYFPWRGDDKHVPKEVFNKAVKEFTIDYKKLTSEFELFLRKFRAYFRQRQGHMTEEEVKYCNEVIEDCNGFLERFPAEALLKIKVEKKPVNIYNFLKKFCQEHFVDRDGNHVEIVFRGKNFGEVELDLHLFRRGLNNLVTDAYNHTPGRPIFVTLTTKKGDMAVKVTNDGSPLTPTEISKIGYERFTRAWHDPNRGYGKMSTRLLTEAQGGRFVVRNSRIGPTLSMIFPLRGLMARKLTARRWH